MSNPRERKYEIYDADADFDVAENSMIADSDEIGPEVVNPPTLPNGDVIDSKNTLQSFYIPSSNTTGATPATNYVSNFNSNSGFITSESSGIRRKSDFRSSSNSTGVTSVRNNGQIREDQPIPIAEGIVFHESPRRNSTIWWVIAAVVLVCAAVVTGVCVSGKCSSKSDPEIEKGAVFTVSPTLNPTMSPVLPPESVLVERAVTSFINNITYYSKLEIVVNGTNPESQALTWLIYDDNAFDPAELLTLEYLETETEISFRVRQRYALTTLWFQQADETGTIINPWDVIEGWLDYGDECGWVYIDCDTLDLEGSVGVQNVVSSLYFFSDGYIGTIPPDIGLLTSLTYLDFSYNVVVGTLPESIGQCSRLRYFDVTDCMMGGSLPSSIRNLTSMGYFSMSGNDFYGTFPTSNELWSNLSYFDSTYNRFTGTLPKFIVESTALVSLAFGNNQLTGTLPESIGLLTNLTSLVLDGNSLKGTVLESIGQLTNLRFLDLSRNSMTGTLPESIGLLTNLTSLSLDNNSLKGTLIESIGQLTKLTNLYLFGNSMTGTLPESIGLLVNLRSLSLSDNAFMGTLPESIGALRNLTFLGFYDNQFSGMIPDKLCDIPLLDIYIDCELNCTCCDTYGCR